MTLPSIFGGFLMKLHWAVRATSSETVTGLDLPLAYGSRSFSLGAGKGRRQVPGVISPDS